MQTGKFHPVRLNPAGPWLLPPLLLLLYQIAAVP
jgi:hypothetical protein